jgi:UDP-glucose 4-epimerase
VYGSPEGEYSHPTYTPIQETYRFKPDDTYGVTKLSGELMVRQYGERYGLDYAVLRLTSTYGPGKLERHGDVGLVSQVIESAFRGEPVVVPSGGDERSDYVYNRDVGRAVVAAAFAERPVSRVYNVGTGYALSMHEVAEVVRSLVPGSRIEIGPGIGLREGGRTTGSILATQRAADDLGFVAAYPFEKGARDYLEWLAAQQAAPLPRPA